MRKVVFIHPDLGIGGAERAMVDAALALRSKNYDCEFYTAHHDKNHCFTETRDGTFRVTVKGDWLPRSIFGYCHAVFAYLRMIYATLCWIFMGDCDADIVICDQISACIPFLKWWSEAKILFYCHFPDKLLASRNSSLQKFYRAPIDCIEECTTGMADQVVVNSKFTAGIFKTHFKSLSRMSPDVVYPVPDFTPFDQAARPLPEELRFRGNVFLSLNRYERKKNIALAIYAMELLLREFVPDRPDTDKPHLIIAGGYDDRVRENVQHHQELHDLVLKLNVQDHVTFLRSVTDHLKHSLLKNCDCLLYTPENEHFGIVPVEAMYCELPVIAVSSGGPLETVADGETGFLCEPEAELFAEKMMEISKSDDLKKKLGEAGKRRMIQHFSFESYTEKLSGVIDALLNEG